MEQDTRRFEQLSTQCSEAKLAARSAESSQKEITLRLTAIQEALAGKSLQAHKLEQAVAQWEEQVRAADQQVEELQEKSKQEELRLVSCAGRKSRQRKNGIEAHLDVEEQRDTGFIC